MPDFHFENISLFQVLVILGRKFHLVYNVWLSNIPILSSCENSGHNIAFENSSDWLPLQILAFTRSAVIREIGPLHTFQYLFRVLLSWRTFDQTQKYCFAMSIVYEFLEVKIGPIATCHDLWTSLRIINSQYPISTKCALIFLVKYISVMNSEILTSYLLQWVSRPLTS